MAISAGHDEICPTFLGMGQDNPPRRHVLVGTTNEIYPQAVVLKMRKHMNIPYASLVPGLVSSFDHEQINRPGLCQQWHRIMQGPCRFMCFFPSDHGMSRVSRNATPRRGQQQRPPSFQQQACEQTRLHIAQLTVDAKDDEIRITGMQRGLLRWSHPELLGDPHIVRGFLSSKAGTDGIPQLLRRRFRALMQCGVYASGIISPSRRYWSNDADAGNRDDVP